MTPGTDDSMDKALQVLRRNWLKSRSPADKATLLSAAMREGSLRPAMVRLAAYAGDPAACLAVGAGAPGANTADLASWVRGLREQPAPHQTIPRAAIAATRLALAPWEAKYGDTLPRQTLAQIEEWLADPSPDKRGAIWAIANRVHGDPAPGGAAMLAVLAARSVVVDRDDRRAAEFAAEVAERAAVAFGGDAVVGEIRSALSQWALGPALELQRERVEDSDSRQV